MRQSDSASSTFWRASTSAASDGSFRFRSVALDAGANSFSIQVTDPSGNSANAGATVTLTAGPGISVGTAPNYVITTKWPVTTLTTVGYGDLHPTTDGSRLFTAIFILEVFQQSLSKQVVRQLGIWLRQA